MATQIHECPECGYMWGHGEHGGHSCAVVLRTEISRLRSILAGTQNENNRLHADCDALRQQNELLLEKVKHHVAGSTDSPSQPTPPQYWPFTPEETEKMKQTPFQPDDLKAASAKLQGHARVCMICGKLARDCYEDKKSSTKEQIDQDVQCFGVAYLVNGSRVDPSQVQRITLPTRSNDLQLRINNLVSQLETNLGHGSLLTQLAQIVKEIYG